MRASAKLLLAAGFAPALALATAGCPGSKTIHFTDTRAVAAPVPVTGTTYVVAVGDVLPGSTVLENLFRADVPDGPWTRITPPGPDRVDGVSVDPFAPLSLFAIGTNSGTSESFAFRSDDRGQTWNRLGTGLPAAIDPTRAVSFVAPDPAVAQRVWLGYGFAQGVSGTALFRSDDRGQTWNAAAAGLPGASLRGIAFDAADPKRRLARTDDDVFETLDAGATWSAFDLGLPAEPRAVNALVADPSVAGRAYALVDDQFAAHLFRIDAVGSWTELPAVAGLEDRVTSGSSFEPVEPVSLAVDPANPQRLYLGVVRFGFWTSVDGGATWARSRVGLNDFFHTITPFVLLIDSTQPAHVFAATADGLYRSDDGGGTWRLAGAAGLPVFTITFL